MEGSLKGLIEEIGIAIHKVYDIQRGQVVMENNTKRIALWDNLKFFLIVMVVIGHFFGRFILEYSDCKGIYIFVYSFHMPAFIFIAGLFSKKTVNENRIERALPYLVLYFLMKFLSYFVNYIYNRQYVTTDLLSEVYVPWFCLSMFWFYVITMYTKRYHHKYIMGVALIASCLAGYSEINADLLAWLRTVTFYPFFYLGYIWEPDKLSEKLSGIKVRLISAAGLILMLFLCIRYKDKLAPMYDLFTGRHFYADLPHYPILGGVFRLGVFLLSLTLTFMLISIMPRRKTIFSRLGQRTLAIYAFHENVITVVYITFGMNRLPALMPYGWQLMAILISILIAVICTNFVCNWIVKKIIASDWKQRA